MRGEGGCHKRYERPSLIRILNRLWRAPICFILRRDVGIGAPGEGFPAEAHHCRGERLPEGLGLRANETGGSVHRGFNTWQAKDYGGGRSLRFMCLLAEVVARRCPP